MHIMITKRPLLALLLMLMCGVSFAQSDEFGRASAGLIELSAKSPSRISGSFGFTTGRGYGATLGGTIVNDRLWFFGTGQRNQTRVPQINTNRSVTIPSSFLSLHSTGIVSGNNFFTAKVSTQPISPNRPLW